MSLSTLSSPTADATRRDAPMLDVAVPVYNEEIDLEPCVRRLHAYLTAHFPYRFRITVADNASTDSTADVARKLTADLPEVTSVHLTEKGRGRALKHVWTHSDATVLAYLDVDLSTDLGALFPLVAPLISGHSELAIGSRLARGSRVVRGVKREFISRSYNLLLRGTLSARFSDAQCGFKAIRSDVADRLLPMVEDAGWFFDTEMLVLAERAGLRIHEVPVDWVDDPDSRVDIVSTAIADVKGIARLTRALGTGRLPLAALREQCGRDPLPVAGVPAGLTGELIRFAAVGAASTLVYLLLYAALRTNLGPQWANSAALLVTATANTAANRRLTFGVRGSRQAWTHQAQGLLVFAVGLGLTSGSLALLAATVAQPSKPVEAAALVAANLIATGVRFLMMRLWVFRPRHEA
jgi:putative flippase GtrA